jgi:hypothetical protein
MIATTRARAFRRGLAAALCCAAGATWAQGQDAKFASDEGRFDGDHLRLRSHVWGFKSVDPGGPAGDLCAPAGSVISVHRQTGDDLFVRLLDAPAADDKVYGAASVAGCPEANRLKLFVQYKISKAALEMHDIKRSGVNFGALVVPFKFRLGKVRELTASSTVAPYVGFRTAWLQGFGLSFTPILSAGVGMVPVVDPETNTTTTKSAFSVAIGFVMGSSKNDSFNSGLLLGRDFLGGTEQQKDPAVGKPWISFYVGYAL